MSATTLARNGRPELVLGSPGDDRIISAVVQVVSHWVDVAEGLEAAVAAHRIHTLRGGELLVELPPEEPDTLLALERHGHLVTHPVSSLEVGDLNAYFGGGPCGGPGGGRVEAGRRPAPRRRGGDRCEPGVGDTSSRLAGPGLRGFRVAFELQDPPQPLATPAA